MHQKSDQDNLEEMVKEISDALDEILGKIKPEQLTCSKCDNIFPFAEPNQKDGSFICFSCRNYG